jgi:hypothetical protein
MTDSISFPDEVTLVEPVIKTGMCFLRFPDADVWTEAATNAGYFSEPDEEGNTHLMAYTLDHAIDVVGIIVQGGEYDFETGEQIVAPEILPGFHVNFQGELPESWNEFLVAPANPYRVFA